MTPNPMSDDEFVRAVLSRTISHDDFHAKVLEWAKQFVPPNAASRAVGLIKRACQSGADVGLAEGLALERELQQRLFEGADAREGLEAHLARRTPQFTGR